MKRLAPYLVVLALACGGGDKSTGPAAVATVTVSPTSSTVQVGQTATLTASPRDIGGNPLSGRIVTWSSSNTGVASVTSGGVVTGLAAGSATITATVESKAGQASITVGGGGADCASAATLNLAVGDVKVLSGTERAAICIPGGASGSEYTLIAVNASTARLAATVSFSSSNTTGPTGSPLANVALPRRGMVPSASPSDLAGLTSIAGRMPRNLAFERELRRTGAALQRAAASARRAARASRSVTPRSVVRTPGSPASIKDLPSSPAVGTLVTLNASSTNACTTPLLRGGRVRAVSATAIVVEDTLAPPGGFTDGEYLSIATTFDTLIFPLDTMLFGAPFDMDANGRVLLFFTTAVNERTPPGSGTVVGGFFFERDLFRRDTVPGLACATSNEGEMFYLPVVDAGSQYNGSFTNKATMLLDINSTTIHEFQHLINASRRIWVTPEIVETEEVWLNEAMSHLAEEMLYFRVAGLASRSDLNFNASTGGSTSSPRYTALVSYQVDNLSRYNTYIKSVETVGSFTDADDLGTRGASWALLRWALDHSSGAPETSLRALVNAPTQGIPNFNNVFPGVGGLAGAVRDATISVYTDNLTTSMNQTYSHLSWNFRDWLPHFVVNSGTFPLSTRAIIGGIASQASLVAGGSTFARFRVNAGATGGVTITLAGAANAASVELILVRSQ